MFYNFFIVIKTFEFQTYLSSTQVGNVLSSSTTTLVDLSNSTVTQKKQYYKDGETLHNLLLELKNNQDLELLPHEQAHPKIFQALKARIGN